MSTLKKMFASKLLEVKAIKLQPNDPFTWASGWKSPIYTDNRKTLAYPELRSFVKQELVHLIHEEFPEATAVAGVATGAIAQGALVADELLLPYCYVRPKPKDHGMGNQIEGTIPEGARVVVVEDLISTGGSSLKAVDALRKAGFEVVGMVASYTTVSPSLRRHSRLPKFASSLSLTKSTPQPSPLRPATSIRKTSRFWLNGARIRLTGRNNKSIRK